MLTKISQAVRRKEKRAKSEMKLSEKLTGHHILIQLHESRSKWQRYRKYIGLGWGSPVNKDLSQDP